MKSSRPTTALCSSTLEMGIDIGAVRLVGQIGAPWSVASLTQRLGRSGRQPGEHRRLRCYADCTVDPEATHPARQLPLELLQTVAACELMLEGWVEPPAEHGLDLSTLTHQIIGTIAELGAITAQDLHATLCTKGPFRAVGTDLFARLLRSLGEQDIIEQDPQGPLILGLLGEKLRAARDYYAAFSTRTEFSVIAGRTTLGTLPVERLPQTNDRFVFAARRWRVTLVETERREIHVAPAGQSKRPLFASSGGPVHHQLVDRMRTVLADRTTIAYLDDAAAKSLAHARDLARDLDLARRGTTELSAAKSLWLTWTGTAETTTAEAMLASVGIQARAETIGLICDCPLSDLDAAIGHFSSHEPDLLTLAEHVEPKQRRKYDEHLSEELLTEAIASTLVWKTP
ncbi:MAG: helicase-related protein [Planctomycetota bacterium]